MKVFWLLLLSLASVLAVDYTFEDDICVLNSKNFGFAFSKFRYVVVQFYITNDTLSQYIQTARQVNESLPGITFCKFDATDNIQYKELYELERFPVIKFFIGTSENPATYEGNGKIDDMTNWLKTQLGSLVTKINSLEDLDKFTKEDYNENVGIYIGSDSSDAYKTLLTILPSFDDVVFVRSDAEDVKKMYEVDGDAFFMSRNHNEEETRFTDSFTVKALKKFVEAYRVPLILPLDKKTLQLKDNSANKDIVFLVKGDDNKQEETAFRAIAEELRGEMGFVIASKEDTYGDNVIRYFDLKEKQLPALAVLRLTDKKQQYILDRSITVKNLEIFLENYFQDNLVQVVKSSAIPRDQYDGDVCVVVQKTFQEIVLDDSKDVLIEFYNPRCGHCIAFAPTYAKLGTELKDVQNLVIAKIDAVANKVENVYIRGYPTLLFYPRGGKDVPIEFNDRKEVEALKAFIKEKGTVKLDEPIGA